MRKMSYTSKIASKIKAILIVIPIQIQQLCSTLDFGNLSTKLQSHYFFNTFLFYPKWSHLGPKNGIFEGVAGCYIIKYSRYLE